MSWQIAIDGPAGAGKSTIAKMLADRLGFEYIDTGAMYRAVTLKAIDLKINMYEEKEYKFLEKTKIDFINQHIYLDGVDVSDEIRSLVVSNNVSLVASIGYVRSKLVSIQQQLADDKNVIMDGRDIGTVVLPNANLKIFLSANVEERAKRRMLERIQKGQEHFTLDETIKEIEERDYKDSNREIDPLMIAPDAIVVDTSLLSPDKVVDKIINLVLERGYKMENLENKINEEKTEEVVLEEKPKRTRKKKEALENQEEVKQEVKQEVTEEVAANTKKPRATRKKVSAEDKTMEELKKENENQKEETTPAVDAVVEEKATVEEEEIKDDALSDDVEAIEADDEDKPVATSKYRELQVVEGTVVEVLEAKEGYKRGNKEVKAKPERVLIELEDGQQGFLFRKDTADIKDDEDLFDLFFEGDKVKVVIKKIYPDGGKFIFSTILLKMRDELKKYDEIIKNHGTFKAKVVKKLNVGYLLKDDKFSCLLPESQVAPFEGSLIGQEIEVAPIRIDYGRIRVIVSQTLALALIRRAEKQTFIDTIHVGDVFEGTVKNIESYGAFVEIGHGVEGLLHISELDHNRVFKVDRILKPGDKVQVKVIKLENEHIGLSRKALIPNLWQEFVDNKQVNDVVEGKIVEINNAGIVVELAQEVTGFLPKSEFAYERDVFINDYYNVNDTITAKIIEIDPHKKRIILSRKQLTENPWETVSVQVGGFVEVEIVKDLKEGYKVNYQGLVGYLPKASIANYDKPINVGDTLKVKVRIFDPEKTRFVVQLKVEQEKEPRPEKVEREVYGKFVKQPQDKLTNTLGDLFEDQLKKLKK